MTKFLTFWERLSRTEQISQRTFWIAIAVMIFAMGTFIGKKFSDGQNQMRLARSNNCDNLLSAEANKDSRAILAGSINRESEVEPLPESSDSAPAASVDPLQELGDVDAMAAERAVAESTAANAKALEVQADPYAKIDIDQLAKVSGIPVSPPTDTKTPEVKIPRPEPKAKPEPAKPAREAAAVSGKKGGPPPTTAVGKEGRLVGNYVIQVASVFKQAEAISRVRELKGKGLEAFYVIFHEHSGVIRYRVCIGEIFARKIEASAHFDDIRQAHPTISGLVLWITR